MPATHPGPLTPLGGLVEFAEGRGRLDLQAMRHGPVTVVNGIELAPPAGRSGDYYLFSDTALVLVRPRTRTYAQLRLSDVVSSATPALLPSDELMRFATNRIDTVTSTSRTRGERRVPLKIQMHVDVVRVGQTPSSLARASINAADAPAGETSAMRWLGAARILAALAPTLQRKPGERLQLTAVAALRLTPNGAQALLASGQPFSCVASADIDRTRLILPHGYAKIPWPPSRAYR